MIYFCANILIYNTLHNYVPILHNGPYWTSGIISKGNTLVNDKEYLDLKLKFVTLNLYERQIL